MNTSEGKVYGRNLGPVYENEKRKLGNISQ
jgi:hypothetical protein